MEAVAHKTRKGFNCPSSSSNAIGQPCKGFSLIEAAIVLAVVGAVIGTIWVSAANMYESYKVNKTVNDLQLIVKNIQGLISIRDSEAIGVLDLTQTLIKAGAFPKDWVNAYGTGAKNPFGGASSVSNDISPPPVRFSVNLLSVPQSACIKLLVKISSMGAMSGSLGAGSFDRPSLSWIIVNPPLWSTNIFPVSLQTSKTACSENSNYIIFVFGYTRIN